MNPAERLTETWNARFQLDCPELATGWRKGIVRWLMGENPDRLAELTPERLAIVEQGIQYRYHILKKRYLGVSPQRAYQNLIRRLSGVMILRDRIRTWIALSRDRQRTVVEVLQEVLQSMMQTDQYLQQQAAWIAQCTCHPQLRNILILVALEEYCLRPIRNQPLLVCRFVNYLRRVQRAGITHLPEGEFIRLVSEELALDEEEGPLSLLDSQAIAQYQDQQAWEEQQALRLSVQWEFETYLAEQVDPKPTVAEWFKYYTKGRSQEEIAQLLNLPIRQVYRLREKVVYHAIRVFAFKLQPQLVEEWLGTSLQHNLGLTATQWQTFLNELPSPQQEIVQRLKAGESLGAIAQSLKLKTNQVSAEWCRAYLAAQVLRSGQGTEPD